MKNFKRVLSMLLLLSMVLSMLPAVSLTASAASATLSFANGDSANHETLTFEASGVSAVFAKNTHSTAPRHDATCVRFYGTTSVTNSLTVSAPSGSNITAIAFTMNGSYGLSAVSADSGAIDGTTWTGSANAVVFTTTAQTRIEGITVTYGTGGGDSGGGSGTTGGSTFTLVTNASSLAAGDEIVIVARDYDVALSTTQNSNNRGEAAITKSEDGNTVTIGSDTQVLTLGTGTDSGTFSLSTGSGYLYAASSSANHLKTKDALDANGSWAISIASDGTATLLAQGTYTHNFMQYNLSSKIFSCYTSTTTTQKAICIYKSGEGGGTVTPTSYAVRWSTSGEGSGSVTSTSGASGATVPSGTSVTMTITPDSGSTVESVTVNGTSKTVAATGGSITFTVSAATEVKIVWGKKSAPAVDVATGNYVIAAKVGNVYYAMSGTIASKISGKVITVTDGAVNAADAAGYVYTVTKTGDSYTIYNGEKYLKGATSGTNLGSSTEEYTWTLSAGLNGSYRFTSDTTTNRGIIFRAGEGYNEFGFYAVSGASAGDEEYFDIELIPVSIEPGGITDTFVKVTSTDALGRGYYLIVCEDETRLFDSSREDLVGTNTYQIVTIDKSGDANKIVTSLDYAFSIDVTAGLEQATIMSSTGYFIGNTTESNGILSSKDTGVTYTNNISIDANGNAVIKAQGGKYLRYNNSNSTEAFRYYLATSVKSIALYKSQNYIPGDMYSNISWSETGAEEGETGGTITVTDANGTEIAQNASLLTGTELVLTVTPAESYEVASVKIGGKTATLDENGQVSFTLSGSTEIVVTWKKIVIETMEVDLKIVSGLGKIEAYRGSEMIGSLDGRGGDVQTLTGSITEGEKLTMRIYPAEGYRLVAIENGGKRVALTDVAWNESLGAYVCEITINGGSDVIGFSFLPRKSDIGVVAELATEFVEGKYIITGTTYDSSEGKNQYDPENTYLLFGCNELLEAEDLIGRKAAALNLAEAGITIQTTAPHTLIGATKGSLYDFKYHSTSDGVKYYTIQICGMDKDGKDYYLAAKNSNDLLARASVTDACLWSVSIDEFGVATIINKQTSRILKFNTGNNNLQFRAYENDDKHTANQKYYAPVLYKATVTGYQVTYSKEGLGTLSVYNKTYAASVASGSIQNEDSVIVLGFTPAQYNSLQSVTVNGVDYTSQVSNGELELAPLSGNLDIKVVFTNIVISNDITVNYYVDNKLKETLVVEDLSVFTYMADLSRTVVIDGDTYKYSALTFEYSENVNTGAMFANSDALIPINNGHVINLYFITSAVILTKTAVETTKTSTDRTVYGGDDNTSNFAKPDNNNTSANHSDDNGNVKQTYTVTLEAQSSNWLDGYTTGGNTDIIVILDNSLSMYYDTEDGTTTNKEVLYDAFNQFLQIVFEKSAANNRVALITYHTTAYAHLSTTSTTYRVESNLNSAVTYEKAFMTSRSTLLQRVNEVMVESKVDAALDAYGGTTNPESAFILAKQIAGLRPKDTDRDLVVIMFTDGKPTSRLTDNGRSFTYDALGTGTYSGGSETSSREFNEALAAGQSLRTFIKSYTNCDSTIYSVALLNALESSGNENKYYTMVKYLYGAGSNARKWVGAQDNTIVPDVGTSSNWTKTTAISDVYRPIYSSKVNIKTELKAFFEQIAYTVVEGKFVTINGSIQDVIPPRFALTAASEKALRDAGWTITKGANGTTISKSDFPATHKDNEDHKKNSIVTYEIEYLGYGYGSEFTNSSAGFTYVDGKTKESVTANFFKPAVEVIPWTVDDHAVAELRTDLVIDIIGNDLFSELTAGGYTIKDYNIKLTDANGVEKTYMNAVEQNGGDPKTYFDAELDVENGTVTFYTETDGSYEFYYVVSATLVKPDGTEETVYSRVTAVEVVTPNAKLNKTAKEVTNDSAYSSYIKSDDYGNVQQLYLITLTVDKMNEDDKIYGGELTDKIPADFEFVKFVTPASNDNLTCKNGVITWTGIKAESSTSNVVTLQFLLRYIGKGYGTAYTNTYANFTYNFGSENGPETTQYFPVPVAGLNPSTVNDVDIAHSGDTNTLNVLENDLFTEDGFQLPNYPASDITVSITDADGDTLAEYVNVDLQPASTPPQPEVTTAEDGTQTITYPYGVQVTIDPNGNQTTTNPEGTQTSTASDGSQITTYPNGTVIVIMSDDTEVITWPDGLQTTIKPDGTETSVALDGTQVTNAPNGTQTVVYPDGTQVVTEPDGTQTITKPDGTVIVNEPNGVQTVTYPNGDVSTNTVTIGGMEITVNADGTVTYTAPDTEGPVQFYYQVESTVTQPLDSTYAESNSTTLISRPTMVTVYTITDKYLVVDFGYKTDTLSLLPNSGIVIDEKSGTKLSDCITFTASDAEGAYGKAEYVKTPEDVTFAFSPLTMNFYATDHFETNLSTTKGVYTSAEREIASGVTVIPANNLFFEEDFINYGDYTPDTSGGKATDNGSGNTGTDDGTVTGWSGGAWLTLGEAAERTQSTDNIIYGYDDAYITGEEYSGGSTKAVTVTPSLGEEGNKYGDEYGYFTFTGTGFDIYATCSRDTGVIIAEVYAYDDGNDYKTGTLKRVIIMDTYFDGGEGVAFDQLPVVMCHDLTYGRYTVKLRAYYHAIFDHQYVKPDSKAVRNVLGLNYNVPLEIQTLDTSNAKPSTRAADMPAAANGKYNVYVDSVRIYNPLCDPENSVPTEQIANQAYTEAGEINAFFTNIRDHILDVDNWTAGQTVVNGFLYIADQRAEELIPGGNESGATTDQNGQDAPPTDGVYLSPTGRLETSVENGKTYLLNQNDEKAAYEGSPVYIVYITEVDGVTKEYYTAAGVPVDRTEEVTVTDPETGEETTETVTIAGEQVVRIGYRYEKDGKEQVLPSSKLKDLNIIHYVSRYEAFGPKYEVHLTNGNGIAFNISNQAHAQVSAKMADNGSAEIHAYYTKAGEQKAAWHKVATVNSRTEMYYDLTGCIERYTEGEDQKSMLIIKCVSSDKDAILSLCNLKTSGESGDVAPAIDGKGLIRAAFAFAGKGDALEETETVLDENIAIGQTLSLESDLTMNFRIKETLLKGYDMNTAYLTIEQDIYPNGAAKQVEIRTLTEFKLERGVMIFSYSGISAAQMNDEMRVVLHIQDAMGNAYESPVLTTSVTQYAKLLLEVYGAENAELTTLVMDMLNYGAAAQRYFDRHADAPANEAYPIFADFADCATAEPAALENLFTEIENGDAAASVGITLDMANRVGTVYRVSLPEGVDPADAVLNICDAEGKLLQSISLAEAEQDDSGRYVIRYYGSTARQMRDVIYATVTASGETISNTYGYSISSYAYQAATTENMPEALAELTKLMVAYGDSAAAYFG